MDALLRFRFWQRDAGREHHPPLSQPADRERNSRDIDAGVRAATARGRIRGDGWSESRCHAATRAQEAQHQGREGRDQSGQVGQADLVGKPNKAHQKDVDAH